MNSNSRFPYWTTSKHTIGGRLGNSAAADGSGYALGPPRGPPHNFCRILTSGKTSGIRAASLPVCPNPSRIISAKTSLPLQPDAELRCSGGAARIPRGKDTGIGYRSRVIGMIKHVEEVHVESQTDFLGDADKLERRRILGP